MAEEEIKQLAARLKGLRDGLDLTVEEMAENAGIPVEDYKKMEAEEMDIPIGTLQMISRAYGVSLDVLLFGEEPKMSSYFLTRANCGVSIERTKAYKYQSLASGFRGRLMHPLIVTIEPADTDKALALNSHPGQEFMMVLEGEMELTLGGKTHVMHEGDSIYFNSGLQHGMRALGGKAVKILSIHN